MHRWSHFLGIFVSTRLPTTKRLTRSQQHGRASSWRAPCGGSPARRALLPAPFPVLVRLLLLLLPAVGPQLVPGRGASGAGGGVQGPPLPQRGGAGRDGQLAGDEVRVRRAHGPGVPALLALRHGPGPARGGPAKQQGVKGGKGGKGGERASE